MDTIFKSMLDDSPLVVKFTCECGSKLVREGID